jgi:molybdopterin-containing oxidoreductase family membrane subunit
MAVRTERLPYGVGRFSVGWFLLMVVMLAVVVFGIYAYSRQIVIGHVVTGMRDTGTMGGAPWGLYIAFLVYFVGVSFAGVTIAALIRLLNLDSLRPISRMAEVITVIALVLAVLCILPDLGRPLRGIVNLFRYARPQSPFFGTFTLVLAGYLFASLVFLYLGIRRDAARLATRSGPLRWLHRFLAFGYGDTPAERERHSRTSFWLALAILPLLITAHSTLGFVFGLQIGRPGWFGSLQAPGFVALAGVSGVGLVIVVAAIVRQVQNIKAELNFDIFKWLGNLLMVLTVTYLHSMVVELLTNTYAARLHEASVTSALISGQFAWIFWTSVVLLAGSFLVQFLQFVSRRYSLALIVLSGIAVNFAAIGKRYLIVVPSQTHGNLLPYGAGSYNPTWVEYGVVAGIVALGILLFALFMKLFPIVEMPESFEGGRA